MTVAEEAFKARVEDIRRVGYRALYKAVVGVLFRESQGESGAIDHEVVGRVERFDEFGAEVSMVLMGRDFGTHDQLRPMWIRLSAVIRMVAYEEGEEWRVQ